MSRRELIAAIFNQLGHPIEFEELVCLVAGIQGTKDEVLQSEFVTSDGELSDALVQAVRSFSPLTSNERPT